MILDDLIKHNSEWLKGTGPNSEIVISSRIRLARNLEKYPFPHWASKKQSQEVLEKTQEAASKVDLLKKTIFLKLADLDVVDKQFLIERHLMSHEHATRSNNKGVIIDEEEVVAIMINEEDHLRIQVMRSGFDLFSAWNIINQIDDSLSGYLSFAYQTDWGYLTACPTNTGTGMRGSVMLHLPALVMTHQINKVLAAVAKLGFNTRGLYGEGTQAAGNFFQISNQVSLGHTEEEIIDNINGLIRQIVDQEKQSRDILMQQNRQVLEDRIWRSFGILKNAFIISSQEVMELLSLLRLGVDVGVIKDIDRASINELFLLTQPAHLQKLEGKKLTTQERDARRASIIRKTIEGKK